MDGYRVFIGSEEAVVTLNRFSVGLNFNEEVVMAASALYVAAYGLLALEDDPAGSMADRQYAFELLRKALDAEGEPSAPTVVTGADGSVTTTWWDATFEVVDAAGSIVTPRGKPAPAHAPGLAADEFYDDDTGRVFKAVDVVPAGTTAGGLVSPVPVSSPVFTTTDATPVPPVSADVPPVPAPTGDPAHDLAVADATAAVQAVSDTALAPATAPPDQHAAIIAAAQADLAVALTSWPDSPQLQDLKLQLDALAA